MKILVSDKLESSALELLRNRGFDVSVVIAADLETLSKAVADADGWIIRSSTRITESLIQAAPALKVIGRAGVGVDNIDVKAATLNGIAVLNTPSGNTMAAVEHSIAMLLALARHIPFAHHSLVIEGSWERAKYVGTELYGKTIGILGLGKIGARVATRCRAMEMIVLGYDPFYSVEQAKALGVELIPDIATLLPQCDFLSLHLPRTKDTIGLLGAERLRQCKLGVRIINCARGGLIEENALADALRDGHVAGAAIDVFENEPPIDSPLLSAPNLVATPHLGASTIESQQKVSIQIVEQVADALEFGVFKEAVNIPVRDWSTFDKLKPQITLVERLGQFAQQYARGGISRVEIDYCGQKFDEIPAINNAFLKGLLKPIIGEGVNSVNAPLLAQERGIEFVCTERADSGNYQSLVKLQIHIGDRTHSLAGTVFTDNEPRLVYIDDFEVDLLLFGVLVLFGNYDRPGVIGGIGSVLGESAINISHFSLGRSPKNGEALGVVAVDEKISDELLSRLSQLPSMHWVTQVVLES